MRLRASDYNRKMRRAGQGGESALPTVIAGGQSGFAAEELREMAGVGVADVEGY
jgi:hypothetical protein